MLLGPPPFGAKRLIEPAEFEESLKKNNNDSSNASQDAAAVKII